MQREKLIFCGTSDLAGHLRGKAFPAADWDARAVRGMGMPPANIMLSAFGPILATPFGTAGDVALVPDPSTRVDVWFADDDAGESFVLADIMTGEGRHWECCPRHCLRRALDALKAEAGVTVVAAFEQEFYARALVNEGPGSFRLASARRSGLLGEALLGALRAAGLVPESFVPEYATGQFEVTIAPAVGLRAADEAVITREMIRAVGARLGQQVTLAPLLSAEGVGSGTHIHISFLGEDGSPALHEAGAAGELSPLGRWFVAGIAHHLPEIAALTAPSAASFLRLRPNKWAPTAADVGERNRGAAIRLCTSLSGDPQTRARQFNVEFRVCDATASPYMALGAVLHAGLEGIRRRLDLAGQAPPLPQDLAAALDLLRNSQASRHWMGPLLHDIYLQAKRAELAALDGLSPQEVCDRYVAAY
jgi:glutamine synthetase